MHNSLQEVHFMCRVHQLASVAPHIGNLIDCELVFSVTYSRILVMNMQCL